MFKKYDDIIDEIFGGTDKIKPQSPENADNDCCADCYKNPLPYGSPFGLPFLRALQFSLLL